MLTQKLAQTQAQGAGLRSYFAPYPWYEAFTDWIENLPEVNLLALLVQKYKY